MSTDVKFVFIAATVIAIFAAGSVLMGLISTGTKTISPEVSNAAADYSSTFLDTTLFLVFLAIVAAVLLGSRRPPF